MELKQVIVIRKDLKMGKGKTAVQAAHASVGAFKLCEKRNPEVAKKWYNEGMKKIAVYVENEKELFKLKEKIKDIPVFVVADAGLTQLEPGTVTCMGIGPVHETKIDEYTGKLKLVN